MLNTAALDRRTFLFAFGGTALTFAMPGTAEAATWTRLGSRRVNGQVDVDRMAVGAGAGRFRRLRLRVRGDALLVHSVRVRYANGGEEVLQVRNLIPQGGYTRSIDLRGANRAIRSVSFAYGAVRDGGAPTFIDLYGIR